jgi:4-hydroxy-tetrahydrodipicolinate synthase
MHDMCAAALQGDKARAQRINEPLMSLHKNLFLEANPIPVKWALYEMGLIRSGIRLPMTMLSEQHHEAVRQALKQANIL